MDRKAKPFITPEEYLDIERKAEFKSEYYNGEMFALAGAGYKHNLISINLAAFFNNHFKDKDCFVFINDMRLLVEHYLLYTYPDVMAICGEIKFGGDRKDIVLNPLLISEVLSKSTESYDRGKKFEFYRSIPSLKEFILVSTDRPLVEVFSKDEKNQWVLTDEKNRERSIQIPSLFIQIPLKEIYSKVDFESAE